MIKDFISLLLLLLLFVIHKKGDDVVLKLFWFFGAKSTSFFTFLCKSEKCVHKISSFFLFFFGFLYFCFNLSFVLHVSFCGL